MSQENLEIARPSTTHGRPVTFSAAIDYLDPHVVFVVSPDFPAFGVHVGRYGVRDYPVLPVSACESLRGRCVDRAYERQRSARLPASWRAGKALRSPVEP